MTCFVTRNTTGVMTRGGAGGRAGVPTRCKAGMRTRIIARGGTGPLLAGGLARGIITGGPLALAGRAGAVAGVGTRDTACAGTGFITRVLAPCWVTRPSLTRGKTGSISTHNFCIIAVR